MISFGEFLKNARLRAELKQVDVEKKTGINHKSLSNWENNVSKPSTEDLMRLADLYATTMDTLVGKPEPPKPKTTLAAALPVVSNIIKTLAALSPQKQEQAASYIAFLAQDDKKA